MAVLGVARFNFTVISPDHTLESLRQAITEYILQIPGITVAQNTFSLKIDQAPPPPQNPPMPGFNQIRGTIRHKD